MNVVDSSGWLAYFADEPTADDFAPAIEDTAHLLVPTISILEVFKRVFAQRGEDAALQATSVMRRGTAVDLEASIALLAGRLGVELKLPLADSVMLATARMHEAVLWTQDADFQGIEGVEFIAKRV